MAIFQFGDSTVPYDLFLNMVDEDTLILLEDSAQKNQWDQLIQEWSKNTDEKKTGKLCFIHGIKKSKDLVENTVDDVQTLIQFIEGIGCHRVDLVGQTGKDALILALAFQAPEKIRKIVILDPSPLRWGESESAKKISLNEIKNEVFVLCNAFDKKYSKVGAKELEKTLPQAKVHELKESSSKEILEELIGFL
ncbi:MAG: hypothetical protein KDD34_03910 [Bdellovibrionales bacterium]|nr:hypothetical protein [Bdellovibrionales bacterium]